jgi:hypothetical protein
VEFGGVFGLVGHFALLWYEGGSVRVEWSV